jgi:hypothetical protein
MAPLGGGAVEMAGRRRSIEAASGAPLERWFQTRGGEIEAGVGAVENGGGVNAFYRAVGWRRGGSTVREANGTAKSGAAAGEPEAAATDI